MEDIVITDKKKFKLIEDSFKKQGLDKIHILADFDRTLTKAFVEGEEMPSIISILRDGNYLSSDYAHKAHGLFNKYHPFEISADICKEEKKNLMAEWWEKHFKLLIDSGLNKKDIEKAVKSRKVIFREGFSELLSFLKKNKIPLIIISSSGLGEDSISQILRQEGKLYDNIFIISNSFKWDEDGKAVGIRRPIVHGANKDETLIQNFEEIFERIKERKNVILLGDSLEDVGMIEGFDYDNLLKIGFVNNKKEESYKSIYDVLVLNDSSLKFIQGFLEAI